MPGEARAGYSLPVRKRGFRALSEVSSKAAALLPPEEAALALLAARVPAAREGGLAVRRSGDALLLSSADKNVRHSVAAFEAELVAWLRRRFPDLRRIRWTSA